MTASEPTPADSDFFGAVHSWLEGDIRVYKVVAGDGRVARWEKKLPDGRWRKVEHPHPAEDPEQARRAQLEAVADAVDEDRRLGRGIFAPEES